MTQLREAAPSAGYWDDYYASRSAPTLPSQFAVFVLNEIPKPAAVVEYGCGIGRDTLFFAAQNHNSIGFDASPTAIEKCRAEAAERHCEHARFGTANVESADLADRTLAELGSLAKSDQPIILYARFFIHAITDEQERVFTSSIRKILDTHRGVFAVEFRTQRDLEQTKTTQSHYRRFVNPLDFIVRMNSLGLHADYFVEGFGFAKYQADDAHVARLLLHLK